MKRWGVAYICLVILCLLCAGGAADHVSFAGGDGSSENPYQISTLAQLHGVREYPDAHFILCSDIDLSSTKNWLPIGSEDDPFTGTFDGNGYRIFNVLINSSISTSDLQAGNVDIGFFGYTSGAKIINLGIEDASYTVNAGDFSAEVYCQVGGIAGTIKDTVISQCCFKGNIHNTGGAYVLARSGGIAAIGLESTVSDCYVNGEIFGNTSAMNVMVAGLIPWLDKTNVERCYVAGKVSASTENGYCYAGGIHASGNVDVLWGQVIAYCGNVHNCAILLQELTATGASVIKNDIGTFSAQWDNMVVSHDAAKAKDQATYERLGWNFDTIWFSDPLQYPALKVLEEKKGDDGLPKEGGDRGEEWPFRAGDDICAHPGSRRLYRCIQICHGGPRRWDAEHHRLHRYGCRGACSAGN